MKTYVCVMIRNSDKESWGFAIGYPIGEHYTALGAWKAAEQYVRDTGKVWPKMQFKLELDEW